MFFCIAHKTKNRQLNKFFYTLREIVSKKDACAVFTIQYMIFSKLQYTLNYKIFSLI